MDNLSGGSVLDCVIIGSGPAGLAAALYLARYNRRFAVIDNGASRAAWIPESHNIPAFAEGIAGPEILMRQRRHAEIYGATITKGTVTRLKQDLEQFTVSYEDTRRDGRELRARFLLLATGVVDIEPKFGGVEDAVHQGLVRFCPICDGYEAKGKNVAVIGYGNRGLGEAIFIARTYTPTVTLLSYEKPLDLSQEEQKLLHSLGIVIISEPIRTLAFSGSKVTAITGGGATAVEFDVIYSALGVEYRSGLATALGAASDDRGAVWIGEHSQTTVPSLYAAGDVTQGLNQIVAGMGQAAIAATDIHNRCL
ncbi:MAG: NAD(P)/FAD-dependent oxidoreductase [Rhodomicrobium sp.]